LKSPKTALDSKSTSFTDFIKMQTTKIVCKCLYGRLAPKNELPEMLEKQTVEKMLTL
jgi:hypothetical protein